MTSVASKCRRDVLDRLKSRTAHIVLRVADRTVARCTLEDAVDVAGFATHQPVLARKRKARTGVVKLHPILLRARPLRSGKHQHRKQSQPCHQSPKRTRTHTHCELKKRMQRDSGHKSHSNHLC